MSCGLELIVSGTWEEFEAMEDDLASCNAVHVNSFDNTEAFHAAALELLEAGFSVDDNYYRGPAGEETFSLWYYLFRKEVSMLYTVTRQHQWPSGDKVVEVSEGGTDYANPDALVAKFPHLGEDETFDSPIMAVAAAIKICDAWREDGCPEAQIAYGSTAGMTLPFEPCSYEEAQKWARALEAEMPKCDRCGELLPEQYYTVPELDDEKFCREFCAEEACASLLRHYWTVTIPYYHKFTVVAETEAEAIALAHDQEGVIVGYDDNNAEVELADEGF